MVNDAYLSHYARMNGFDPGSASSLRAWYTRCRPYYRTEIGRFFPTVHGRSFLDLGSGAGAFLDYLCSAGAADATGVDMSPALTELCRSAVPATVHCSDVFDFLRSADRRWNVVTALDLIEHLPASRVTEFLAGVHRVLEPGGAFIVRTPNMSALTAARGRYVDRTHESGFTEQSLVQLMGEAGFTAVVPHNAHTGPMRLAVLRTIESAVAALYGVPRSRVVTYNLLVHGRKSDAAVNR